VSHYTITRHPSEPILLAVPSAAITITEWGAFLDEIAGLFDVSSGMRYFLMDWRQYTPTPEMTERFLQWLDDLGNPPPIFAFIGGEAQRATMQQLQQSNWHVPVFRDENSAYSYLNLKIGSAYMRQSQELDTKESIDKTNRLLPETTEGFVAAESALGGAFFPAGGLVRIEAVQAERSLLIIPEKTLILGRRDAQGNKPDVDLSLWAGYSWGVSRQHAKIALEDGQLFIYDLGSTNGTAQNGERLVAHRPYALHDGDELRFGELVVRIYYQV